MTISYNWLSDYLTSIPEPQRVSEILTSVGLEVEHMEVREAVKGGLQGLVVGQVMECSQHPNADKLRLTKVDIGQETSLSIVCGAPNVAVGKKVIVATVGTKLFPLQGDPFDIKPAKIRGEESQGMICAEDEIGLGTNHDGIIILPEATQIGSLASDFYQLPPSDTIFEIGLTPNHMDAMSHLGCMKNICAFLTNESGTMVSSKIPSVNIDFNKDSKPVEIQIEDNTRCARYSGIVLNNITVKESPEWLQTKLKNIGLRPINNIVDITNFVLHECGQPLHAFDLKAIKGNKIIIKTAAAGEKFLCLDEKERTLDAEDLMICNAQESMCIAGVFGGLHSGVTADTTEIFLESAWFEPESIRKTSLRHGLRTDAASRFEKGADISQVIFALQRAASLMCEIAGANVASAIVDIYPVPFKATEITISFEKIRNLAGKNYPVEQIKQILNSLCFKIVKETAEGLTVQVPFAKPDITMQADIVEEIMRIDGLDNIPMTGSISFSLPTQSKAYHGDVKKQVAQQLVAKGFFEIFTNSITNAVYYPQEEGLVKMMNSLSANLDSMRPSMLESGLEAVAYNLNRKNKHLKFFEFGRVYHRQENSFIETNQLALYVSGDYLSAHWSVKPKEADVYYLKGIVEGLFEGMKLSLESEDHAINILFRNKRIGRIVRISEEKLLTFDIKQSVWFVELNWDAIQSFYESYLPMLKEIPRFPIVQRDLALIIDKEIHYSDIQKAVKQAKSKLLHEVKLFDVFESEKLGINKKSYGINLSFYNPDKTLTDAEVEADMDLIKKNLEQKISASIRGNS